MFSLRIYNSLYTISNFIFLVLVSCAINNLSQIGIFWGIVLWLDFKNDGWTLNCRHLISDCLPSHPPPPLQPKCLVLCVKTVNGIHSDHCKSEIRIMEVNWNCAEKILRSLLLDTTIRILTEFLKKKELSHLFWMNPPKLFHVWHVIVVKIKVMLHWTCTE